MHTFTTPILSWKNHSAFVRWFETNIGTEIESDEYEVGRYFSTCFDLEAKELRQCQAYFARKEL